MSEVLGLLRKFHHTPWRDLLRGRLSGRLDVESRINTADLPEPAKSLIRQIVYQRGLWRMERIEVADELLAHFADGLESGATLQQLIDSFGDQRVVAKLIRRAKSRNRPWAWRVVAVVVRLLEVVIVLHMLLAAYFLSGKPSPNVDYIAIVNRPILQIPPEQRAWPLYRQAILATADYQPPEVDDNPIESDRALKPGGKNWPWVVHWLDQHAAALQLVRQAAAKPALGFVLGPNGSQNDPALGWEFQQSSDPARVELRRLLLPHLDPMRILASHLVADAQRCRQQNDRATLMGDLSALLGMAEQLRAQAGPSAVVAGFMQVKAMGEIQATLTEKPQLLEDSDLRDLAHQLSRWGDAATIYPMEFQRLAFYDTLQHAYTQSDGRFTLEGIDYLDDQPLWGSYLRAHDVLYNWRTEFAVGPELLAIVASRQQIEREFEQWAGSAEAELHEPMRQCPVGDSDRQLDALRHSYMGKYRYAALLDCVVPARAQRMSAERLLGRRDGMEVALALELYHRQYGRYPVSLDQLVPALLPCVPADRITGDPVRYRLVNGRPIIYSVGADRRDDGSKPPIVDGKTANWRAAKWGPDIKVYNGDWVLYPDPDSDG
ncbi:MAG: hypothetical protein ABR964_02895 [Tepidisphaeraceae bacterium]|jgi:hypothetical protein